MHGLLVPGFAPAAELGEALQQGNNKVATDTEVLHVFFLVAIASAQHNEGMPELTRLPRQSDTRLYITLGDSTQTVLTMNLHQEACRRHFPHSCPHRADEVVAEGLPKLLLRGEII